MKKSLIALTMVSLLTQGCISYMPVKPPTESFQDMRKQVNILFVTDEGIPTEQRDAIVSGVVSDLDPFGIDVGVLHIQADLMGGSLGDSLTDLGARFGVGGRTHRVLGLVKPSSGAVVFNTVVGATFGLTESTTGTWGNCFAETAGAQHGVYGGPVGACVHEVRHMMGCDHGSGDACISRVEKVRDAAPAAGGFFPAQSPETGELFFSPEAVVAAHGS